MESAILDTKHKLYPECLKDYGVEIRYKGNLIDTDTKAVVVIGSRECTRYGRKVTRSLVKNLVAEQFTIISGLAYGIDSWVHRFALEFGGRTMGFTAAGLQTLVNSEMIGSKVAREILQKKKGVVFSPFEDNYKPDKDSFILRNYIMAAFGQATIIVEAGEHSGTFHTADAALDFGKQVLAVPGSIFNPKSMGTSLLLKEGASLCTNIYDILAVVG